MMDDPELQEIFTDPAHQEVVDLLKAARPAAPPLDPHFRSYLRTKLMTEAQRTLPARSGRSWFRFGFSPRTLAPAMAAVAAGFLVVLGIEIYLHGEPGGPAVVAADVSRINNKTNVAAGEPIQIPFSGPVDKNAVAETVVIEPATSVTKQWVGSTLVIIPDHPLAPNTTYTVRLQPKASAPASSPGAAATPSPTVAPTPVVVHFTTVRAPIPPVVPPSFMSSNVSFGHDSRLAESNTIISSTWTAAGQLLVTRPAGQAGPAPSSSPSASPPASGAQPKNTGDVWLMSPLGTPLREVAPDSTLPSAPASGSMFAAWTMTSATQARLDVRDLQGSLIASVATINGTPDRPAIWVGTDRLAYLDSGVLKLVDLHGTATALPPLKLDRGSVAASPTGGALAVQTVDGSFLLDLSVTPAAETKLHPGATGFDWSARGELAFLVQHDSGSELYVAADGKQAKKVAASANGQSWSDLNWAPDSASLLLATKAAGGGGTPGLLLINRDGSTPTSFGAPQREYAAPQWSPSGDLLLFTRHDEAGGTAFWTATSSPSGNNAAEQQALAEVEKFMQARISGDAAAAQAELDDSGRAAYQAGASSLVSAAGTKFARYYPVTVQLGASNPNEFLIGVRIFISRSGTETSFFEEQLSLLEQGQRYRVHAVKASPAQQLSHGPIVVAVEVVANPPGQIVRVRFDADVKAQTVSSGTILIKDQAGTVINAQVSFDPDNHLAALAVKLRPGSYQLVVTTGVTDINGTPLAQEYDAPLLINR